MKILLGTNNQNKLEELKLIFSRYAPAVELVYLTDLKIVDEVEEDADNLSDNAKKKAKFYAETSGLLTVADDTGLFVDALDGEPGVHAKRWHEGSEHDRCVKLLERLKGTPQNKWTCRYIGVLVAYDPDKKQFWQYEASCEGLITEYFRGENGFGYDQIFKVVSLDKQYAELTKEEKLQVSHRSLAIKGMVAEICL